MKWSELWAHTVEPDILVTSFPDSSFGTTQKKDGNRGRGKQQNLEWKTLYPKHILAILCL